jgi:hypothetical protein
MEEIIKAYNKWHKPLLNGFLSHYENLTIKEVIESVTIKYGEGPFLLSNPHYKRIRNKEIAFNSKKTQLLNNLENIIQCEQSNFEELYNIIKDCQVTGINDLMNYDISLAIGSKLNKYPNQLYLHRSVINAARALMLEINNNRVHSKDLNTVFGNMKPHHIENMLCIYNKAIIRLTAHTAA